MDIKRLYGWARFTALLLVLGLAGAGSAQLPEMNMFREEGVPTFYYDINTRRSAEEGKSLLDIALKVEYDELQFVKTGSVYQADYEISVTLFNKKGEQAYGRIVNREVKAATFEETNASSLFSPARIQFEVDPATYDIILGIMDKDSRKTGRLKTSVQVPAYNADRLMLSSLMMADTVATDSTGDMHIVPNVLRNFGDTHQSVFVYYEIYNPTNRDSTRIVTRIRDIREDLIREEKHMQALVSGRNRVVQLISRGDLKSGRYELQIQAEPESDHSVQTKDFSVRWLDMPAFATDLEQAVEQMKYIAKGDFLDKLEKAEGKAKEHLFRQFWAAVDPSPGTQENELMEEYYRRVNFANAHFGTYHDGWKTDRGMVYIILGPPNDTERHPFDTDAKPHEIWYYHDVNRYFVFVDESGFGEYRLISPFWDVLNQLR